MIEFNIALFTAHSFYVLDQMYAALYKEWL